MALLKIFCWSLIVLISIVYLVFKYKFLYWKKRGVAYLEPTFPLGSVKLKEDIMSLLRRAYHLKENKIVGLYAACSPTLVATDLNILRDIFVKDFDSFADRGVYYNEKHDPLMANLITYDGDKWRPHRAKLSPAFTTAKLKFMYPTLIDIAKNFQENVLNSFENESELPTAKICSGFTLDVVGSCIFGIELNASRDLQSALHYYGRRFYEQPQLGLRKAFLATTFRSLARMLGVSYLPKEDSDFFRKTILDIIEHRTEHKIHRKDFVELVIKMRDETIQDTSKDKKQIDDEIAAESFMFLLAGHDTSASAITLSCYELAKNPDIQEKLRQEIAKVLELHNGELTFEALHSMSYLDMVISETLRKYPPTFFNARRSTRNYKFADKNIEIEKHTVVLIPVYQIHRDPDIYPNPDAFDPERFRDDQVQSRHPMSFLGFGAGPRNCIGMRFGRILTRIGLIMLLQRFRFSPSTSTPRVLEFDFDRFTLFPRGNVPLKVEKIG